jgi:acyl-CoA synthetase (NDP forming)
MAQPGHVALLSQSGALGIAILDWSLGDHVGFSISTYNSPSLECFIGRDERR